jgi:hypothetical protein
MSDDSQRRPKDIYSRRSVSDSRGRTHERVLARQHGVGVLPGAEHLLQDAPEGSIAAGTHTFLVEWLSSRPVTSRRAYERSITIFLRDLERNGPHPHEFAADLTLQRLYQHLAWRIEVGLRDAGELQRCVLHLARVCEWLDTTFNAGISPDRAELRAAASTVLASVPPPFQAAHTAADLRDTSDDESTLVGDLTPSTESGV